MSVLDKNGIEIRVGDTVQDLSDGQESVVTRVEEDGVMGEMVYCKWDGGNTETWTNPVNLTVVRPREKLTLEKAIDFIASLGYTVTITKN